MFPIDHTVNTFFLGINSPFLFNAFSFASWLFNPGPFTVLLVITVVCIYIWSTRSASKKVSNKSAQRIALHDAVFFASSSLLAAWLAWMLKVFVNIPRPLIERVTAVGPSFPSYHAAVATAYFLGILHFAKRDANTARRMLHYAFCILCPLFVGVSRLYLGVHWLSDVLVGYIIGAISVYVCFHVYQWLRYKYR
jgi:undecaprenyl-diphosphatase